jgi:1,4-dihydroxy-2-naphthoate octaprenyltransferase
VNRLITLRCTDDKFSDYLRGTFSDQFRAVAINSLNVSSSDECVTFELIDKKNIHRPNFIKIWFMTMRLQRLIFLLPALLYLLVTAVREEHSLSPGLMGSCLVSLIFLYISMMLRNDVNDYLSGYDRIRSDRGCYSLRNGWVIVSQVENMIWGFLIVAILSALPLIFYKPQLLLILVAVSVLGFYSFFTPRIARGRVLSYFIFFLMHGPLLFTCTSFALTGTSSWKTFAAATVWGLAVLFGRHMRDFENLFQDSRFRSMSLMSMLGFDRAQKFIESWWLTVLTGICLINYLHTDSFVIWVGLLALCSASMMFFYQLRLAKSSLGSQVKQLRYFADYLFLGFVVIWIFECLQIVYT